MSFVHNEKDQARIMNTYEKVFNFVVGYNNKTLQGLQYWQKFYKSCHLEDIEAANPRK